MCGGGGTVQDNSYKTAEIEARAAAEARAADEARRAQEEAKFQTALEAAYNSAISGANDYFSQYGLDPAQFGGAITSRAGQIRSSIPQGVSNPATYFDGLGQQVFDSQTQANRARASREIDSFGSPGFARNIIGDTADDDLIRSIFDEKKGAAEQYAQNLRDRGVITDVGFSRAMEELGKQAFGAKTNLESIGSSVLETGRGRLRDIVNRGKEAAGSLSLGNTFDAGQYRNEINTTSQNFFDNLGNQLRSLVPDDLFDTKALAAFAGRGQGAQNTKFNPRALLGLDEEENQQGGSANPFAAF